MILDAANQQPVDADLYSDLDNYNKIQILRVLRVQAAQYRHFNKQMMSLENTLPQFIEEDQQADSNSRQMESANEINEMLDSHTKAETTDMSDTDE